MLRIQSKTQIQNYYFKKLKLSSYFFKIVIYNINAVTIKIGVDVNGHPDTMVHSVVTALDVHFY